jgi:DNA polymerase
MTGEEMARERAELAFQAARWAELDALFGVGATILPALEPIAPVAPGIREATPGEPQASRGQISAPPALVSLAERAQAVLARGASETRPPQPPRSEPAPSADAGERDARAAKLKAIAERLQGCTKCALAGGRTNVVPGQGDPMAELVFVGEGPGETEDRTGLAFVGKAGELLTKMIAAMGLTRDQVFICNVVKCRPPGNRPPAPDEMATCLPYLEEQLAIIQPRVICALGKTAAIGLGLIRPTDALARARGRFHKWHQTPVMVTFHPSYLLRTPGDKRKAWEDLQKIFPHLTRRASPGVC